MTVFWSSPRGLLYIETSCAAGTLLRMTTANGGQKILVASYKLSVILYFSLHSPHSIFDFATNITLSVLSCFNKDFSFHGLLQFIPLAEHRTDVWYMGLLPRHRSATGLNRSPDRCRYFLAPGTFPARAGSPGRLFPESRKFVLGSSHWLYSYR